MPTLDPGVLARCPEGYRHLQVQAGYQVKPDLPGLDGPEVERLYERGTAWLGGHLVALVTTPCSARSTPRSGIWQV